MNIDGEIISAMLYDAECASRGCRECEVADFIDPDCKRIFAAMTAMYAAGTPIDLVTVCSMFDSAYSATIASIGSLFITTANFPTWLQRIKERRKLLVFRTEMGRCIEMAREESPDTFDAAANVLAKIQAIGGGSIERVGAAAIEAVTEMGNKTTAIPTGFPDLDKMIGGFYPGNLVVVAGRPSMGKSCLAANFAASLCRRGKTVALFSLEDGKKSVTRRMACAMAKANNRDVRRSTDTSIDASARRESERKCEALVKAGSEISDWRLYINDRGIQTAQTILADCYKIRAQERALDLVIVDYLGLIKTREKKNGTRQQEIAEVTRALKLLAKDLNTTVVLVSQLNRGPETRESKKPVMSDLRESGDIEQDADVILFPFRPWVYVNDAARAAMSTTEQEIKQREAWLIVGKNRNGMTGDLRLLWFGQWFLFAAPTEAA